MIQLHHIKKGIDFQSLFYCPYSGNSFKLPPHEQLKKEA